MAEITFILSQQMVYLINKYQPEGKITISCGIAVCPTHALNAKDLIKHADQALYRAKSLDRNKVEMYFSIFDRLDVEGDEKELLNSIRTLVSVINAKDSYIYGHSERVTDHAISWLISLFYPRSRFYVTAPLGVAFECFPFLIIQGTYLIQ
jgi:hypothetical protein